MRITILCDSPNHPVWPSLQGWALSHPQHEIDLVSDKSELTGGDVLFLVSCGQIIRKPDRDRYAKTLVLHAADLPRGRGWSPHVWQIIEGKLFFVLSLIEAEDKVDTGDIWCQCVIDAPRHMLYDEINAALFKGECEMMDWAVANFWTVQPWKQRGDPSYYRKRTPADGALDAGGTIAAQWNLMRVSDPDRYPVFVDIDGHRFGLRLERL